MTTHRITLFAGLIALAIPAAAREPLAARIAHTDPTKFRHSPAVHNGPGALNYMALFDFATLDTNLYFLHRGVIEPHGGIGAHFHNNCEEMFVILDGEAQFTIDGHTSRSERTRGRRSHAIYNPGNTPVQWMNINVTAIKGAYDAFNLNDGRVDAPLDAIPMFMAMHLDRSLLRPASSLHGASAPVQYHRALDSSVMLTTWSYVDHLLLPPGSFTKPHFHMEQAEFYYVMDGEGTVTVGSGREGPAETAPIKTGDAIPSILAMSTRLRIQAAPQLELMIVGVSRDGHKTDEQVPGQGRGGRGN